ncbi:hypothetical protein PCC9214_05000 [Planktothrix tepida]|uniref:WGxxGxxG-CTERM domain-containing protein n=2 Tax=Planktothrix TaxID=54304 RepID=A0A1J1LTU3_9CYAN|nr:MULTISPECIES: WGxxGxxG family protein [Planktothrix]CAD5917253.1 hypothetical protein NO713_00429 [Planktothrix pseudagardhii]CAD5982548.1 hypothetical protein PCC9214_05000 [Planktothrix tepida]CUR35815.1 conserved exported hypothetical protein [Planktothrix tepida PCC 9214]
MRIKPSVQQLLGTGMIALSLAVFPASLPAHAQTNPNSPTVDTTPFQETRDDNNNWGWLGLLGLIGLANLFRQPKTHHETYRDPNVTTRPGYRE